MGQFKKRSTLDKSSFKARNKDRDRDKAPKKLFDADCGDCKKKCKVPFKPDGKHKVFCSDCYSKKDDSSSSYNSKSSLRNISDSRSESRGRNVDSITVEQFKSLDRKIDQILDLLRS